VRATPTLRWLPAPQLRAPENGAEFRGWNAEVILRWTPVEGLEPGEYYVVSVPYDDAGGVDEFWRRSTQAQMPSHYSLDEFGPADHHYSWSVQVRRCTENCERVLDDDARKEGMAVGEPSAERLFYWYPDPPPPRDPTPEF
jgi:hypothetical protein